jgi:hypothetical protein
MDLQPLPSRSLVAYAGADGFADNTISILARLGYEIVTPEGFEKRRRDGECGSGDEGHQPDLFLVEERRLREVPSTGPAQRVPIVVLSRTDGSAADDPRIAAVVRQPVGMHDLYRVVQQVLEDAPRTTLRATTALQAVCRRSGVEWNASVVSLSENGCLLRGPERVPLGTHFQLAFELPGTGTAHVRAETAYHLHTDLGLVFSSISPQIREAIQRFVAHTLLDPAGSGTSR